MPQFVDQEAKAREEKAAFDRQERMPADVADAIAILSERGHGSPEMISRAIDGRPETECYLPVADRLRRPNEVLAFNMVVDARRANTKPVVVPDPVYVLPAPSDPALTMRHLTDAGPMAVAQFQREHPADFERLRRVENNRMAGGSRPLP